jgi:hypothetical protein
MRTPACSGIWNDVEPDVPAASPDETDAAGVEQMRLSVAEMPIDTNVSS